MFLDFCESVHDLLWADFCVYLCGLYVGVAKHFGDDFDGDAAAQGYGGGEGVPANVGGEVFADVGFTLDVLELEAVGWHLGFGQLVIVLLQYLDDGREEHNVELGAGLDTGGAWEDECAIVFLDCAEVGGHEVRE